MDYLIKAAVLAIAVTLIALVLKKSNPEISQLLAIAAVTVMLVLATELISTVKDTVSAAAKLSSVSSAVLTPMLKCVGIAIVTRIAADICKDAGQSSLSSGVELVGTVSALYVSMPLIKTLMQMIGGFL